MGRAEYGTLPKNPNTKELPNPVELILDGENSGTSVINLYSKKVAQLLVKEMEIKGRPKVPYLAYSLNLSSTL